MNNIEEVKSKLSILEIVSGYIRVEKSGSQYKARCPFHNEKSPSFYITPSRLSYHCFGCGESGDIFKFVEKMENLEFKEALKILADRAGVTLSKLKKEDDSRMLNLMEMARYFFEMNLNESIVAKKYLHERGLTDESITNFKIGFAKKDWRSLFIHLMSNGFTDEECVESGLIIKTEDNKYYDRFRGRIMFPIRNIGGATVGFTGRVLPEYDDGKSGKYVNTPETKLYHKSKILFNYDSARKFISENREIILAEGQMDIIMSTQANVKNIVAVSGTAFTEEQVNIIKRLADNVVLAFDNDEAGKKASAKAAIMCAYGGLNIFIVDILEKDIADIVKNDAKEWVKVYENKITYIEFLAKTFLNIKDEREKINYIKSNVTTYLKALYSPLERDFAINNFSRITSVSVEALKSEVSKNIQIDEYKSQESKEVENKIKLSKKERIILDIKILAHELKIDNKSSADILLALETEEEIPKDIFNSRLIELEKENILNVTYYNDLLKEYRKIIYDESHKSITDKLNSSNGEEREAVLLELQKLMKNKNI